MNEYRLYYKLKGRYCTDRLSGWIHTALIKSTININSNVLLTYSKIYEQIKLSILSYYEPCSRLINNHYIFENIEFQIYNKKVNNQIVLEYIIDNPNKLKFDIDVTKPFNYCKLIENII